MHRWARDSQLPGGTWRGRMRAVIPARARAGGAASWGWELPPRARRGQNPSALQSGLPGQQMSWPPAWSVWKHTKAPSDG